jgi:hypothetical protein
MTAKVAIEDKFVPEKELIKSDWSAQVLQSDFSSGSSGLALVAGASAAIVRPLADEEIYLHYNLYSAAECEKLISVAEAAGFGFTAYPKEYRGNLRLVTNDAKLAEHTWARMKGTVPPRLQHDGVTWEATGLNHHWRLSKYAHSAFALQNNVTISTGTIPATCFKNTWILATSSLTLFAASSLSTFT